MANLKHIFLSVILVVIAELLLKTGVNSISASSKSLPHFFMSALSSPFVLIGLLLIGLSSLVWIVTLSKTNLSYAYPFISVGYIATAIFSVIFFNEPHSWLKWAGIAVISMGVVLLSRS